jgi:hypothetical protein
MEHKSMSDDSQIKYLVQVAAIVAIVVAAIFII